MPSLPLISKGLGPGRLRLARLGLWRRLAVPALLLALAGCATAADDPSSGALDRIVAAEATGAEQNGDYATAARHYAALYQTNRSDLTVIEGLARNLRHGGELENARALLEEALGRLGPQGRLLLEKGKAEISQGKAELAVPTLQAAVQAAPGEWEPPATLAIALDRLGRFDEAATQYRAALARNAADNADIYNNFALSRALAGRLDEAKSLLRTAAALPNASSRVRGNLAFLETLQRQLPAAPVRIVVPAPELR